MRKTLILGGAGFIGSNLAKALVATGQCPRIFTRPSFDVSNIEDILDNVEVIYGDFMDDVTLRRATHGVDTVFHLISTTFPSMTMESSVYDVMSNFLPTIRLMEICFSNGVKKIVYASSGGTIYGDPVKIPITEDQPLLPRSAYGQSKLTIENYFHFCVRTTQMDIDILRISNPFGAGQNPYGIQGLIAVAMGCAQSGRVLKIYGRGEAVRDYIYIDDVVKAMIFSSETKGSHVVNISSGEGHSVIDVVTMIEEISGRFLQKEFIPQRPGDVAVNILSNKLAYEIYGWVPQIKLRDGLSMTWDWISKRQTQVRTRA